MTSVQTIFQAIFCGIMSSTVKSAAAWFWQIVIALWPWYWLWIAVGLIAWVFFEIVTRNGNWHYNSKNGFSPTFNIVVGSGTYLLLQSLLHFILKKFLGDAAYCQPWAYLIHFFVFMSTGGLLYLTGFWVYWKLPFRRRK